MTGPYVFCTLWSKEHLKVSPIVLPPRVVVKVMCPANNVGGEELKLLSTRISELFSTTLILETEAG